MADLILTASAPVITTAPQRCFIVATWDWCMTPELVTEARRVPETTLRPARVVSWTSERTTTWTTCVTGSDVYSHLCLLAGRWAPRGVRVLDLATDAPRCIGCGCVEELACHGGCAWSTRPPRDPWICTACALLVIRPSAESEARRG